MARFHEYVCGHIGDWDNIAEVRETKHFAKNVSGYHLLFDLLTYEVYRIDSRLIQEMYVGQ